MPRQNCWECKKCGRQVGGDKVPELGICPASIFERYDGRNQGRNAGRYCWKVAGTLCGGDVQGSYAQKLLNCVKCEFFKSVREEEGEDFVP